MSLTKFLAITVIGLVLGCEAVNAKGAKNSKGPIYDGNSGRRHHGGGYSQQYNYWSTQTRIMSMVRLMIMNLLGDAVSKLKKIDFVQTWAEKPEKGEDKDDKAATSAHLVVQAQQIYNRMARMYTFCLDNSESMDYYRMFWSMFGMKKLGLDLDQLVQAILEHENVDPSGRMYGRRSAQGGRG